MSNDTMIALKKCLCHGQPCRIPAMTFDDLAILLKQVRRERKYIQGPLPRS